MKVAKRYWLIAACVTLGGMGCNGAPGEPNPDTALTRSGDRATTARSGDRATTGERDLTADRGTTGAPSEDNTPKPTLDERQREYLWQIEHCGNLLVKYGFGPIKKALLCGNAQVLADLLAEDFTGAIYENPREVRVSNDFLQVVRQQEAGNQRRTLDAAQFVERLLSYRRSFSRPPKVGINLMKLAPVERDNLDSPSWQGSCLLRMWGESVPGQPMEVSLNLEYRIPKPTEKNLGTKGWLHSAAIVQSLVGHAQRFLLRDATQERGIDPGLFYDNWLNELRKPNHGGIFLCDFDRDGILDLLVTDTNGYFLYKGLPGGKFRDVTREMGLPRQPVNPLPNARVAAFVDVDGDGWEDLILGNHIYRNEEGKRFVDYTFRTNLHIAPDAGGIAVADYDRDGLVDVYVTRPGGAKKDSWLGGKSGDLKGNQLWRNKGNWQFEDVTEASGTAGGFRSTFTALWLDANNDGWPDLYVINEFGNGVLLLNNGNGTFREHQLAEGPHDFGTMGATAGDFDNDGNIDLYCANMYSKAGSRVIGNLKPGTYSADIMAKMRQFVAGSELWHNLGVEPGASSAECLKSGAARAAPRFEKLGQQCQVAAVGWAYGAALVDLDNDGWLDLYATAGFMSSSRDDPDG